MNFFNVALSALMGVLLVVAAPSTHDDVKTIQGHNNVTYTVTDLVLNLKVNETLTVPVQGTIQDAFNELSKYDPVQAAAIKETIDNHSGANVSSTSRLTSTAQNADGCCTAEQYFCDISYDADCGQIADGIAYLKTVTGTPVNGPGPGTCNRVSCSYNSAIYWCNDSWLKNPTTYVLENFTLIADGAQQVVNMCTFEQGLKECSDVINGQQFYSGGWNVIVEGDTC
ncbi:hypothetical protein N0V82_003445 [Gnomoniopsis sp. IMI 355080]|nr:hypothetical protein N0V82_003445 [Gnomoniopsis sp. IMI 355080]